MFKSRAVWSSKPGRAKFYIMLQTVYHRFSIFASSLFPWRYVAEKGTES